jgi:hypothetical protein
MLTRKPHDPFLAPDPVARVFSLDHARRDKEALLAADTDTERRHPSRLLDGLSWSLLTALILSAAWNLLAFVGFLFLLGQVVERIAAGAVL